MTNEEKAKRYDEALDRCKEWASGTCEQNVNNSPKDIAEFIFPQLAESEDEKIREFLIGILSQGTWRKEWPFSPNEVVAYLERQNHIQSDTEKEYVRTLKSLIFDFLRGKQEVDRNYYQQIYDWLDGRHIEQKEQKSANLNLTTWHRDVVYCAMCDKNLDEGLRCNLEVVYKTIKELVDRTPVVEEQKPAEWSEEDEDTYNRVYCLFRDAIDEWYNAIFSGCYPKITRDKVLTMFKSLRPQPKQEWNEKDKKMLWIIQLALTKHPITDKQEKDAFDWLNSLRPNQKYEWSEEDERILKGIIGKIDHDQTYGVSKAEMLSFLKSLRPQPHTVSIEGATKFGNLEYERGVKDGIQSEKSHQWKPSEEQMDALRASNSYWKGTTNEVPRTDLLESLYNDLEKLIAKR